jgi:hypothetical protein
VIINIENFGNTTAATIPLALNDAVCSGRLKKGNLVLLASVGAGLHGRLRAAALGFLKSYKVTQRYTKAQPGRGHEVSLR